MSPRTFVFIAALMAGALASPLDPAQAGAAINKRDSPGNPPIPANIPAPPPGICALLTFSQYTLPIGSPPTSFDGNGIGPSEAGDAISGVINHYKEVVGDFVDIVLGPGFGGSIPLNPDKINDAQTATMTAEIIDPSADWNVNYSYAGIHYTCNGDRCQHYNEITGVFGTYSVHVGHFPC